MTQITFNQLDLVIDAHLKSLNYKERQVPVLLGEPGIGKSEWLEDLARRYKTKVFTIPMNQLADRTDLTGARTVKQLNPETGKEEWVQTFFPHETINRAISYANENPDRVTILFMDEFNRAQQDITSAALSFVTLREINTTKFPDNLAFVMAGNDKGNVIPLDSASISRFVLYNVTPDVSTFFQVNPKLNPFIREVLQRHPEDLTAKPVTTTTHNLNNDPDDEEDNDFSIEDVLFDDESMFEQITVPRTITNLSTWLNTVNIDKSGSDAERETLMSLITESTSDDTNLLYSVIAGTIGDTTLAEHIYNEIHEYHKANVYGSLNNTNTIITEPLRPDQDVINELSKAQDADDVETLISYMSDSDRGNLAIWLLENANVKEINNNNVVEHALRNSLLMSQTFEKPTVSALTELLQKGPNSYNQANMKLAMDNLPSSSLQHLLIKASIED